VIGDQWRYLQLQPRENPEYATDNKGVLEHSGQNVS
jgi:hypothetical protein